MLLRLRRLPSHKVHNVSFQYALSCFVCLFPFSVQCACSEQGCRSLFVFPSYPIQLSESPQLEHFCALLSQVPCLHGAVLSRATSKYHWCRSLDNTTSSSTCKYCFKNRRGTLRCEKQGQVGAISTGCHLLPGTCFGGCFELCM